MAAVRTPEPTGTLAPQARLLWRLSAIGSALPTLPAAWLLGRALPDDATTLRALLWAAVAVYAVVAVGVAPELRWRRWRYEIRPDEIDIRHGAFTVTRTLVPMRRVQHVDTEQGLLQQTVGDVATIAFHTAAGRNSIPHLPEAEAARVRDRIAELTKARDEL